MRHHRIEIAGLQVFQCMCGKHACTNCNRTMTRWCGSLRAMSQCPHCGSPVRQSTPVRLDRWTPDNVRGLP